MSESPSFEIIDPEKTSESVSPVVEDAAPLADIIVPVENFFNEDARLTGGEVVCTLSEPFEDFTEREPEPDAGTDSTEASETLEEAEAASEDAAEEETASEEAVVQAEAETETAEPQPPKEYVTPLFSICLTGKDVSAVLPRFYASISEFTLGGGEVVMLDLGSTDDTVSVAEKLGIRVVVAEKPVVSKMTKATVKYLKDTYVTSQADSNNSPFYVGASCPNASWAKNEVAKLATNDIQLHLSPVQEVYVISVDYINSMISAGLNSFFFNISNKIPGNNAESISNVNCFYDRRLQRWEGTANEELYTLDNQLAKQIRNCSMPMSALDVIHWRDSTADQKKLNQELLIGAGIDAALWRKNGQMVHSLGLRFVYSGLDNSALKTLERHLQMDNTLESRRSLSACVIGQIWLNRAKTEQTRVRGVLEGFKKQNHEPDDREIMELAKKITSNYELAKEYFLKAFNIDCGWRTPLLGLADISLRVSDWDRAIIWAKAAKQIKRTNTVTENLSAYIYGVDETLMKSYFNLWKQAKNANQSVCTQLYNQAYNAYQRCKQSAAWLPSVATYDKVFQYDEQFANQFVTSGEFEDQ